jgi:hypothetical protein
MERGFASSRLALVRDSGARILQCQGRAFGRGDDS